jgi:hypothetical protein
MLKEAMVKLKLKVSHTVLGRPLGFQEVELPGFLDNQYMKVARLSVLLSSCLNSQEIFLVPQSHSMAKKNK